MRYYGLSFVVSCSIIICPKPLLAQSISIQLESDVIKEQSEQVWRSLQEHRNLTNGSMLSDLQQGGLSQSDRLSIQGLSLIDNWHRAKNALENPLPNSVTPQQTYKTWETWNNRVIKNSPNLNQDGESTWQIIRDRSTQHENQWNERARQIMGY